MPLSPLKPLKMWPNLIPEAEILTTFIFMINKQDPAFRAEFDWGMDLNVVFLVPQLLKTPPPVFIF